MQLEIGAFLNPSRIHSCRVCTAHRTHEVIGEGHMASNTSSSKD